MSSVSPVRDPLQPHLEIPVERVWPGRFWLIMGLIVAAFGVGGAWKFGLIKPSRLWTSRVVALKTLTVDEGTLDVVVTENGSLESSNNATIRCEVEALIGLVGGATQAGGAPAGRPGGAGGQGGRPGGGGQAGGQGGQPQQAPQPAPVAKKKAQGNAGAAPKGAAAGGAASGSALVTGAAPNAAGGAGAQGGAAGGAAGGGGAGGAAGGGGTGGAASSGDATGGANPAKPVIRSFTYMVPPYMPLRPKPPGVPQQPVKPVVVDPNAGGGRRRNSDPANAEKPGSTRIISILPEGTRVKAGEVVCGLDSSAFRDELQAQKIRTAQAKALVEQAKAILDVNVITYEEYRQGIYPQDVLLVRQYLATCAIDSDRARKNLAWSMQTAAKGFRTPAQVKADIAGLEKAELTEQEAKRMLFRLEKFTGPRLRKNLQAKIEAIRADKLAQDSVYQLENDRLRRLELMVANCTLRAPRDGIVVYANVANGWGQTQNPIDEGVTVRQGQALINLPDPNHMRVLARINESKVSSIHAGQKAQIRVDAFPNQPLMGTVESVTPIPAPSNRSGQDVRVYYALVEIDSGGFDALRPGLSAEVDFLIDHNRKVTRVPLQAVRWFQETPFAAVVGTGAAKYVWRRLQVGLSDVSYMEVVSGVGPGDRVIARPDLLDPPPTRSLAAPAFAEARPTLRPRG